MLFADVSCMVQSPAGGGGHVATCASSLLVMIPKTATNNADFHFI